MSGSETEFLDDTQVETKPEVDVNAIKEQAKQEALQEIGQRLTGQPEGDVNDNVYKLMLEQPAKFQELTAAQAAKQAAFQADVNAASEWLEEAHPELDELDRQGIGAIAGALLQQGKATSVKSAMKKAAEKYTSKGNANVTENTRVLDLGGSPKPKAKEVNLMAMSPEEFEAWEAQNGLR